MNETTTAAAPVTGEYLTARQLAEMLNVSEKFVRKHLDAGRLRALFDSQDFW